MSDAERIAEEAARWIVQNQDDPPPEVLEQLAHWLMRSEAHVRAYLRISRISVAADPIHPVRPSDELIELVRVKLRKAEPGGSAKRTARKITSSLREWLLWRWRKRHVGR